MLDYMIKMNMLNKGLIPTMHMVRHNTPSTSLGRKKDSRGKSITVENVHERQPSTLDISAYSLNHDIRGYFKN